MAWRLGRLSGIRCRIIDDELGRHVFRLQRIAGFTTISVLSAFVRVNGIPVCVDCPETLFLFRVNHGPSFVCPAVWTCMVGELPLTTLGTGDDSRGGYLLVCPTLVAL